MSKHSCVPWFPAQGNLQLKKLINAIHVKALKKDFLLYLKCILHSHRTEEGSYVYSLNVGQKNYLILCVRSLPLNNSMHTLTPHYLGMFRFMIQFAWSFTQSIRGIPRLQCLTQLWLLPRPLNLRIPAPFVFISYM